MSAGEAPPPLIAHVLYRFDTGGLENGVVNLINRMPASAYRHAVIALTDVVPAFAARVQREGVEFVALHKPAGHGHTVYARLHGLFRRLRPAIVHTRNLAALEMQVPAALAGVRVRIHGEHGRDVDDLDGTSRKHQWIRRAYRPFVGDYVTVSRDLAQYLEHRVGVPQRRVRTICNGVDTMRFAPAAARPKIVGCPFGNAGEWLVGTVGRMQAVKGQTVLAHAFVQALARVPALRQRLRLVLVGDGPLRAECEAILRAAGLGSLAWLPGERADVPDVLRGLDCFVLPSLAEGISNTILEAMACGLPVLATAVGGNAELVSHGRTGWLVPGNDVAALAQALIDAAADPAEAARRGQAARAEAEARFSLAAMVDTYRALYDSRVARHA